MPVTVSNNTVFRKGPKLLRAPEVFALKAGPLHIKARRAHVYEDGRLLFPVVNETVTVSQREASILVDPLSDTEVWGPCVPGEGTTYVRYFASCNGEPARQITLKTSQFGPRADIEYLPLDAWIMDSNGPVADIFTGAGVNDHYLPNVGTDVVMEDQAPMRNWDLPSFFIVNAPYLIALVCNAVLTEDNLQNRFGIMFGSGTKTAPVWEAAMTFPVTHHNGSCGEVTQIVGGIETTVGFSVVKYGFIYPPFSSENTIPRGSFQVYGTLLERLCSSRVEANIGPNRAARPGANQ